MTYIKKNIFMTLLIGVCLFGVMTNVVSAAAPYIMTTTSPPGLIPQPTNPGNAPGSPCCYWQYGTYATIIAEPVPGYTFQKWTDQDISVSTDASYTFQSLGNRQLVAVYTIASIPEFPTIALPVITVLSLIFLFQRKSGN